MLEIPRQSVLLMGHTYQLFVHESTSDCYYRKGYYSVIMQAVIDYCRLFIHAYIGWPAKVHNATVLVISSLYQKAMNDTLHPDRKRLISSVQMPLIVLRDSVYLALYSNLHQPSFRMGILSPRSTRSSLRVKLAPAMPCFNIGMHFETNAHPW